MEEPVGWRFVAIGVEGDSVLLGGADAWSAPWSPVGDSLTVPHPHNPEQRHRFTQYSVKTSVGEVVFAAGEYSNGVWGFFERG